MSAAERVLQFQGSAALLDSATKRMESALADRLSGPVCAFFATLAGDAVGRSKGKDNANAVLKDLQSAFLNYAWDDRARMDKVVAGILTDMEYSADDLAAELDAVFINRARIFSSAQASGAATVEVQVPSPTAFVRRVLVTAAQAFAGAPRLFYSAPESTRDANRYAQREQVAMRSVRRALDDLQPPSRIAPRKQQHAPQAEQKAAAPAKAPSVAGSVASKKAPSVRAPSIRDMGFEEEEEEEEEDDGDAGDHAQEGGGNDDDDDEPEEEEEADGGDAVAELPAASGGGPRLSGSKRGPTGPAPPPALPDTMSVLSAVPPHRGKPRGSAK
jgi:hypothetical protein